LSLPALPARFGENSVESRLESEEIIVFFYKTEELQELWIELTCRALAMLIGLLQKSNASNVFFLVISRLNAKNES